jgi:hypothetical protein
MKRTRPARHQILEAANIYLLRSSNSHRHLTARHINQAVCICRFHGLVSPETLIAGGFRAKR